MYQIVIQQLVPKNLTPPASQLKRWAKTTLTPKIKNAELTIRIVDETEMTHLNGHYRGKHKTTNVLAFPFDMPTELADELPILGDIVLCAQVINEEARTQEKTPEAHWAHILIHGILHLLGYNHETLADAAIMEPEEIALLKTLGFSNPYF